MKRLIAVLYFVPGSLCFSAKGQLAESIEAPAIDSAREEYVDFIYTEAFEPEFRGGNAAWLKFLQQNLKYPRAAWKANIQGVVVVQFVVNADGKISDIEALSGPEELRQAAIDVIKKSPQWIPVKNVKSTKGIKKQPIIFRFKEK
ncbi:MULTISPECIES: TonB family protein [Niastella]|uniref:TonB family protein n=1 Tax=Niastella soli TaxID=2821487 RepID=A0ABS3YZK3_9BACT|nr:TonB family protein [Niastella soli]MBO9203340.1 TonB family protein [Niastella soli]